MTNNSTQFPLASAQAARSLKLINDHLAQIARYLEVLPELSDSKPIPLQALPHPQLRLLHPPLWVSVFSNAAGDKWQALLPELRLFSRATRCAAAVTSLSRSLVELYLHLEPRDNTSDPRWILISQMVGRIPPASPPPMDAPLPLLPLPSNTEHQTISQWVKRYSPNPSSKAWADGAHARLQVAKGQPEPASRYRNEPSVTEWRAGYQALTSYLDGGGLIICPECHQSLSPAPNPATPGATQS